MICEKCESHGECVIQGVESKFGKDLQQCDFFQISREELLKENEMLKMKVSTLRHNLNRYESRGQDEV